MVGSSSHFSYDHLLRNPSLIKENSGSPEYGTLKRFQGDNLQYWLSRQSHTQAGPGSSEVVQRALLFSSWRVLTYPWHNFFSSSFFSF